MSGWRWLGLHHAEPLNGRSDLHSITLNNLIHNRNYQFKVMVLQTLKIVGEKNIVADCCLQCDW